MADWQDVAVAHRQKQKDAIPKEWLLTSEQLHQLSGQDTEDAGKLIKLQAALKSGILTAREVEITEKYTARQLVDAIARGELKSVDVVVAFSKRAAVAQQLINCVTEVLFTEGIERAKELDRYYAENGKVTGPLHGLPISLKDSFAVKGYHASVGFIEHIRRPAADTNSAMVDLLFEAGAVFYCKTNVPQTMMTADSENNVFGRTVNPHNSKLTAGGSTGGEGALIAFRGSPLGVGTDIAGSIRIPSLCNGIYGFRPTSNRTPFKGQYYLPHPSLRLPGISPVAGPMANSVGDLQLFMETVIDKRPWRYDSECVDIPWREVKPRRQDGKLTIGVLPADPEHPLHPPVKRALEAAATALEKTGHTVVRLPNDPATDAGLGNRIAFQYFGLGHPGLDELEKKIGEPLVNSVRSAVHPFTNHPLPANPEQDLAHQLGELNEVRAAYSDNWRKVWLKHDLDVILAPGAVSTTIPHDTYGVPVYTTVWNALDYPAGIIPFGYSSKEKDPEFQKGAGPFDPHYDPELLDGVPCALQVVAPRFRDEECLDAIRIIDEDLRK